MLQRNIVDAIMRTNPSHELLSFAQELARAAADAILPIFRQPMKVSVKQAAEWDPVTEGDRAAELAMRKLIEATYPDHGILGEEFANKSAKCEYTWVLDPIDGTRAFVIGMPTWATLIGLYKNGKPLIGVMNQPFVGDMFYGSPEGAWLDHRGNCTKIAVKPWVRLKDARLGTTTPHLYKGKDAENFEHLRASVTTSRYGGDAYFFCLLAAGHLDIAMDCGLQAYDIAALIPIIEHAGGHVATWDDKDPSLGGNILAASSRPLLNQALEIMKR